MAERRTIGDILRELGRITQADVDRALEHQRQNGGFFGEALVALGLLKEEELGWSLASQFDLPFVFPDAGAVDPDAASLVSPDWALEQVALPVARTSRKVVLVVASPLNSDAPEQLRERTGLEVELALAPPGAIRDVIRQVYRKRAAGTGAAREEPVRLGELADLASQSGASRWGVSSREGRALGWYDQGGAIRRFPLTASWEKELNAILSPGPSHRLRAAGESAWRARLEVGPGSLPVEVRSLSSPEGWEILLLPGEAEREEGAAPALPESLLDELRLLLGRGALALALRSEPPELARDALPHLPGLLLPPGHRTLHLSDGGGASRHPGVLTLVPDEGKGISPEWLARLRDFRFDAVTVDAPAAPPGTWEGVAGIASLVVVLAETPETEPEGVGWLLELKDRNGEEPGWTLRPVGA